MSKRYVLDSSAILAVINSENGEDKVEPKFRDSVVSSVNVAEVLTKLAERDVDLNDALNYFLNVGLEIAEFDIALALRTAALRPATKHLGLSLGDRACLALAMQENAIAVTADKTWKSLDVCKIELIR